jgi:hypothetical protein
VHYTVKFEMFYSVVNELYGDDASSTTELQRNIYCLKQTEKKLWGLVRLQTISTERPPLVGEVSANFSG